MFKFIGCIFLILSSSGLGYIFGTRFSARVRELKLLKMSLQMLETEIVYSNTPLPDAFEITSQKSSAPIKYIFKSVSLKLKEKLYGTVGEAFEISLNDLKDKMSISKEDIEILKTFGYSIGNSDTEGQIKSFKMIIKQLEAQEIKAEESRNKNEKMYKNLGFLAGLAISILLL